MNLEREAKKIMNRLEKVLTDAHKLGLQVCVGGQGGSSINIYSLEDYEYGCNNNLYDQSAIQGIEPLAYNNTRVPALAC